MKKTNNKGFSLVELIIVIAIMAILVGAIAPALIRYIDKSRKSNDVSACKTIKTAIETAMANEDAYEELTKQPSTGTGVTTLVIEPNKKLTVTETADPNASIITITLASGDTVTADTRNEIAKNIGDKTPKISYKKAGKKQSSVGVPTKYLALITASGSIYVGLGTAAPTEAKLLSNGKVDNTNTWYIVVPETCDDYK